MNKIPKLIFAFCFLFLNLSASAKKIISDQLRDLLLQANVDEIIAIVEQKKPTIKNLSPVSIYYYLISLTVNGEIKKIKDNLALAYKYGDKVQIEEIEKHLKLYFREEFDTDSYKYLTESEKNTLKLLEIFKKRTPSLDEVINISKSISEPVLYYPTKIDFLMQLRSSEANKLAIKAALELIEEKRQVMFLTTMDFYELASAYKALAINSVYDKNLDQARNYIKLAKENIYKMRSIWVIEDIIIKRPILKIDKRVTKFGYLLPQWLVLLREEYDSFLQVNQGL